MNQWSPARSSVFLRWSLILFTAVPCLLFAFGIVSHFAFADYEQELEDQIEEVKKQYPEVFSVPYFHDMGIIARKADEAELNLLVTKIVKSLLLDRMENDIREELEWVKRSYRTNAHEATRRLQELSKFQPFYQPTDEYLSTTGGQELSGSLSRLRSNTLSMLEKSCSEYSIRHGIQALRKTGLFRTNHSEEIVDLREITKRLDCCMYWKPRIQFVMRTPFESDYEEGVIIEEVDLKLRSSRRNMTDAHWVGQWIYRFEGREGKAEGVSHANLRYRKGEDIADLVISASRVTSVGRINLPVSLSGDHRSIEMEGENFFPFANFGRDAVIALQGCRGD